MQESYLMKTFLQNFLQMTSIRETSLRRSFRECRELSCEESCRGIMHERLFTWISHARHPKGCSGFNRFAHSAGPYSLVVGLWGCWVVGLWGQQHQQQQQQHHQINTNTNTINTTNNTPTTPRTPTTPTKQRRQENTKNP